ncbi:MAG: hypothetical protein EOP53_04095 [Sphingobacteriales bacterium]|nr:MAG: hypothetical protein EOP53_04095 [Sphingobacteriales bacterium]
MATEKNFDSYIAKSEEFAKPILHHLREIVHKACPSAEEAMKWNMPYFYYKGKILCAMASFKEHCSFGFWRPDLMKDPQKLFKLEKGAGMGSFGKIQSLKDLPSAKILTAYIKEAMVINEAAIPAPMHTNKEKVPVPDYFQKELNKNKIAKAVFNKFPPSYVKDYVKWLEEAKTEATREKRLTTAIEWIAEGKGRNWKYMKAK